MWSLKPWAVSEQWLRCSWTPLSPQNPSKEPVWGHAEGWSKDVSWGSIYIICLFQPEHYSAPFHRKSNDNVTHVRSKRSKVYSAYSAQSKQSFQMVKHFSSAEVSIDFVVQTKYIKRFRNIVKKMRLVTRIQMHRLRASGASNLSRYDRFCAVAKFIIAKFKVSQSRFQKKCRSEI